MAQLFSKEELHATFLEEGDQDDWVSGLHSLPGELVGFMKTLLSNGAVKGDQRTAETLKNQADPKPRDVELPRNWLLELGTTVLQQMAITLFIGESVSVAANPVVSAMPNELHALH